MELVSNADGPRPGGGTRLAAVIGDPVRHSLSPVIHNAAFRASGLDWLYVAFEVPAGSAGAAVDAMRALGIGGYSVTMPHKAAITREVDELTGAAAELDVVNTVVRRGRLVVGDNTDADGFLDALRIDEGWDPAGRRAVVLGAGGAARAVIWALGRAGAADVVVVNRSEEPAVRSLALAPGVARIGEPAEADRADLVVNATPLGMAGLHEEGLPIEPERLGPGQLVVDLIYQPDVTPLMAEARSRGAAAVGGLGMLIHQAAHAFRQWTGEDPPLEVMSAAAVAGLAARGGGTIDPTSR